MHTLDRQALNCGLKVGRPHIMEKFYPYDMDKFISFYPYGQSKSRDYSHWREVCRILYLILSKHKISIAQLGAKENEPIEGCVSLNGQLNYNQCSYMINHSLLHLCVDGFTSQFASGLNKKIVCLYGDTPPENNRPFWSNDESSILLTPTLENELYSYSPTSGSDSIDTIAPEIIAESVCKLLKIDFDYPYKTLYIGKEYAQRSIESVPTSNPLDISNMGIDSLIVRMDLNFSEQALANQLSVCDCSILTNRAIDPRILVHFKNKIEEFIYLIDEGDSKEYVQELYGLGIKCHLMSKANNKNINNLKLKYLDYGPIHIKPVSDKNEYDFLKEKNPEDLYYKSSRSLVYNQKAYYCEASIERGLDVPTVGYSEPQRVIDSDSFWEESNKFIFLEKK